MGSTVAPRSRARSSVTSPDEDVAPLELPAQWHHRVPGRDVARGRLRQERLVGHVRLRIHDRDLGLGRAQLLRQSQAPRRSRRARPRPRESVAVPRRSTLLRPAWLTARISAYCHAAHVRPVDDARRCTARRRCHSEQPRQCRRDRRPDDRRHQRRRRPQLLQRPPSRRARSTRLPTTTATVRASHRRSTPGRHHRVVRKHRRQRRRGVHHVERRPRAAPVRHQRHRLPVPDRRHQPLDHREQRRRSWSNAYAGRTRHRPRPPGSQPSSRPLEVEAARPRSGPRPPRRQRTAGPAAGPGAIRRTIVRTSTARSRTPVPTRPDVGQNPAHCFLNSLARAALLAAPARSLIAARSGARRPSGSGRLAPGPNSRFPPTSLPELRASRRVPIVLSRSSRQSRPARWVHSDPVNLCWAIVPRVSTATTSRPARATGRDHLSVAGGAISGVSTTTRAADGMICGSTSRV